MPTATATATVPASVLSLKASQVTSPSSTAATLRSLYPRAARAFLQRDVVLTHSLLTSAFSILGAPASIASVNDALASQRRKWDILRVTFETTLYSSPPATHNPESLPPALRANLMLSTESLIAAIHNRSLVLFTPADSPQKPSSAFLPAQILVTIVLASLKLDCVDLGRSIIEDWLAKHGQEDVPEDPKGYAKVIELYCLHVLPRLRDWDYAEDFLTYERELPSDVRQQYTASLRQLRAEALANARAQAALPLDMPPSSSTSSRSASPTPSDASSSASSTSTHTATPRAPNGGARGLTPLTSSQSSTPKPQEERERARARSSAHSASSQSVASTATSRTVTPASASRERERAQARRPARARPSSSHRSPSASATGPASSASSASVSIPPPSAILREPATGSTARSPTTLALLRASVHGVLQGMSRARALACVVLFVVLPLVSFVLRLRRRRVRAGGGGGGVGTGTVDVVRRRLRGAEAQGGVVGRVWEEAVRAVLDTVSMAGRGLV